MRWCLAVTRHLHFRQRATLATRRWNGYWNKSQHRKLTLEKKIRLPLLLGLEPETFRSRVRRSTTEPSLHPQYIRYQNLRHVNCVVWYCCLSLKASVNFQINCIWQILLTCRKVYFIIVYKKEPDFFSTWLDCFLLAWLFSRHGLTDFSK